MLRWIDSLLDRITMYRLLLYYLGTLLVAAALFSQIGTLHYQPVAIILGALYLVVICWFSNAVFAHVFEAPVNRESSLITAFILALIITPSTSPQNILFLTAAGGLAIASKYLLAINKKHIFNPAAVAVLLTSLGAQHSASWWVGSKPLLPIVLIGGLLLTRKIRRFQMVLSFLVSSLIAAIVYSLLDHASVSVTLHQLLLQSSLFFLAFVMLTEPLTSPAKVGQQRWYGILAGLLFPPQVHLFGYYTTPEAVLVVSNIFAYLVNPRVKVFPHSVYKVKIGPSLVDFIFTPIKPIRFEPGQYMEWTLQHSGPDSRGERRYFTIASSPTESDIRLGVRLYQNGSSYKRALLAMDAQAPFVGAQLGGDFTLPADKQQKLAFIAGGIGITPFRSMMKYLLDKNESRDVGLLYSAATSDHLVYTDVFETARGQLNSNVQYLVTNSTKPLPGRHYHTGRLSAEAIKSLLPDYQERLFYVSGSHPMVHDMQTALHELGVPLTQIKVDFFPGYI